METVVIDMHAVVITIQDHVVVIHLGMTIGKKKNLFFFYIFRSFTFELFRFLSGYDRRGRYSRSRSPVQRGKRDYRPRSRSSSPR